MICFPFLPTLVREMGVTTDPKQVGYYVGIVESLFAMTQFMTVWSWGRLSDRIGRKPYVH